MSSWVISARGCDDRHARAAGDALEALGARRHANAVTPTGRFDGEVSMSVGVGSQALKRHNGSLFLAYQVAQRGVKLAKWP